MAVSDDNTRIIVTLPKTLKEELQNEAYKERRSLSNYVLTIIEKRKTSN